MGSGDSLVQIVQALAIVASSATIVHAGDSSIVDCFPAPAMWGGQQRARGSRQSSCSYGHALDALLVHMVRMIYKVSEGRPYCVDWGVSGRGRHSWIVH